MNAFIALSDPTRLRIFELLVRGEKSAGDIVAHFNFKAPTISQHLRTLMEAKLISVRSEGRRRYYTADAAGLEEMQAWLATVSKEWHGRFNALDSVLAEDEQTKLNPIKE